MISSLNSSLPASVQLFDAYGLIRNMMEDPAGFGFATPYDPNRNWKPCETDATGCGDPATYVNYDCFHKTTRTHELLGDALVQQVSVPEINPGAGLGAFAALGVALVLARGCQCAA